MRRYILIASVLALLLASFAPAFAQYGGQTTHIVEIGETLAEIAAEYGVTVQAIASANGIWNPDYVWAGMRLVIPGGNGYQQGNSGGYYPPPPPQQNNANYYVVRWGDTLASIASSFGVSAWSIAQANHIYNLNQIYAGMYLTIPGGNGYGNPGGNGYGNPGGNGYGNPGGNGYGNPGNPGGYRPPQNHSHNTQYWIKPGDTLASIAAQFHTTVQAIASANNISNPDQIYWGMRLVIPAYY